MPERHTTSFEYFDLAVEVSDDGDVTVELTAAGDGVGHIKMDWDDLREVIDFAGVHGLKMKEVWLSETDPDQVIA